MNSLSTPQPARESQLPDITSPSENEDALFSSILTMVMKYSSKQGTVMESLGQGELGWYLVLTSR
jgi:hypothetical protein